MENTEISSSNDSWRKLPTQYRQDPYLLGGLEHVLFSMIYGLSSFPLTNIFQRGSNHQPDSIFQTRWPRVSLLSAEGTDPSVIKQLLVIDYTLETQQQLDRPSKGCRRGDDSNKLGATFQLFGRIKRSGTAQVLPCITYVWLAWYQQIWGSHPMKIWFWDKQMFFSATHMVILSEKSAIKPRQNVVRGQSLSSFIIWKGEW